MLSAGINVCYDFILTFFCYIKRLLFTGINTLSYVNGLLFADINVLEGPDINIPHYVENHKER